MKRFGQVHCLLDCYASILEEDGRFDFRPLYIGVWDAFFDVNEKGIFYYSDSVDPKDWNNRFVLLYGSASKQSHNAPVSTQVNFDSILRLVQESDGAKAAIVMVDLFFLPYSHHHRSKHTPHFIVVQRSTYQKCSIKDPYFEWEGVISQAQLRDAFGFKGYGKGVVIDKSALQEANYQTIIRFFDDEFRLVPGRLIIEVDKFIHLALEGNNGYAPKALFTSIQEAGVIAKRYGGYRYVLQYVSEGTSTSEIRAISAVSKLLKGWESLMLTLARFQIQNKLVDITVFTEKIDRLRMVELEVQSELLQAYTKWRSRLIAAATEEKV